MSKSLEKGRSMRNAIHGVLLILVLATVERNFNAQELSSGDWNITSVTINNVQTCRGSRMQRVQVQNRYT